MRALQFGCAVLAGVTSAQATDDMLDAQFILGDVHDNPAHHLSQARTVVQQPKAVVFEILAPELAEYNPENSEYIEPVLEQLLGCSEPDQA